MRVSDRINFYFYRTLKFLFVIGFLFWGIGCSDNQSSSQISANGTGSTQVFASFDGSGAGNAAQTISYDFSVTAVNILASSRLDLAQDATSSSNGCGNTQQTVSIDQNGVPVAQEILLCTLLTTALQDLQVFTVPSATGDPVSDVARFLELGTGSAIVQGDVETHVTMSRPLSLVKEGGSVSISTALSFLTAVQQFIPTSIPEACVLIKTALKCIDGDASCCFIDAIVTSCAPTNSTCSPTTCKTKSCKADTDCSKDGSSLCGKDGCCTVATPPICAPTDCVPNPCDSGSTCSFSQHEGKCVCTPEATSTCGNGIVENPPETCESVAPPACPPGQPCPVSPPSACPPERCVPPGQIGQCTCCPGNEFSCDPANPASCAAGTDCTNGCCAPSSSCPAGEATCGGLTDPKCAGVCNKGCCEAPLPACPPGEATCGGLTDPKCLSPNICDKGCCGPPPVVQEICNNGIDDDGDNLIDCTDPDCATDPACYIPHDCKGDQNSCLPGTYCALEGSDVGSGCLRCSSISIDHFSCVDNSECKTLGQRCGGGDLFLDQCINGVCGHLADCNNNILESDSQCDLQIAGSCTVPNETCKLASEPPQLGLTLELCVCATPSETGLCNDGLDNDADFLVDCDDPDCFSDPACLKTCSPGQATCGVPTDPPCGPGTTCTSGCCVASSICGNTIVESGELCDGKSLSSSCLLPKTCPDRITAPVIACDKCQSFDVTCPQDLCKSGCPSGSTCDNSLGIGSGGCLFTSCPTP